LETDRLLLRPPEFRDVPAIATWLGDYDVAKNLAPRAPSLSRGGCARIRRPRVEKPRHRRGLLLRHHAQGDGVFMGCCGLHLKDGRFELGYWLGKPFWGQGYATEAAKRVVSFAFRDLKATSVWAGWFHDNPASGRVLEKLGCRPNGLAAGGARLQSCCPRAKKGGGRLP
jgi:ribosomal-protein-alanine N-acetyltransferase